MKKEEEGTRELSASNSNNSRRKMKKSGQQKHRWPECFYFEVTGSRSFVSVCRFFLRARQPRNCFLGVKKFL
jgi:hypothetical protein